MQALEPLLQLVGAVVLAGGGLSLLVYGVFKHLAAKWLDARFDQRLQALKHEQQKEIERLKVKVSALLDRAVKLHQREFEVLPEAWGRLNDAYWQVRNFVSPLQTYPDVSRMNAPQFEQFINDCRLLDWQKAELRAAGDKNAYFQDAIFWHKLSDAQNKSREAYSYLMKNGIFIKEEVRQKFAKVHDLFWNALVEHEVNHEHKVRPLERKHIGALSNEGDDLMKELERIVHERLWPATDDL